MCSWKLLLLPTSYRQIFVSLIVIRVTNLPRHKWSHNQHHRAEEKLDSHTKELETFYTKQLGFSFLTYLRTFKHMQSKEDRGSRWSHHPASTAGRLAATLGVSIPPLTPRPHGICQGTVPELNISTLTYTRGFMFIYLKDFIYLLRRDTHTQRQRHRQREEKRAPRKEPTQESIPGPRGHPLSRRQMLNH